MKNPWKRLHAFLARQGLFFYFLRSYLVLFALLLTFSLTSYYVAIRQITTNMETTNTLVLEGINRTLDIRFQEAERMAYRLTSLPKTSQLAYMAPENPEYYNQMTKYVKDLWTLWLENDKLTPRMYVYFARTATVAGPTTFYDCDSFYGTFFRYGSMEKDAFFSMLLDPANNMEYLPARSIELNDSLDTAGEYDLLTFVYQLRPASGNVPPGAILYLIDTQEIRRLLESLEIGEGGVAAIVDDAGRIVVKLDNASGLSDAQLVSAAEGQTSSLNGQMVISALSSRNGWRYVALGSPQILMKPVLALSRILALLLLASVGLGFTVAFLQAKRRSQPLSRLAERLSPERMQGLGNAPGYSILESGVENLLDSNRDLKQELSEMHPMMTPALLHQIFGGFYDSEDGIRSTADRMHVSLPSSPYSLVLFRTLQGEGLTGPSGIVRAIRTRNAIENSIQLITHPPILLYEVDPMQMIWICGLDGDTEEQALLAGLDRVAGCLDANGFRVEIRFTPPFQDLSSAWWEFAKLQRLRRMKDDAPASVVAMAWRDPDAERRQYKTLIEPILLSAFRSQDERMLQRLFELMGKEYFENPAMSDEDRALLLGELQLTAEKLAGPTPEDARVDSRPDRNSSVAESAAAFERLRTRIHEATRRETQEHPRPGAFLYRRILGYVDPNLFRPDLSLTRIADHLKISEAYLSRVFKEHEGESPSDYIERKRLEESVRLLQRSDLGIAEIAIRIGYLSDTAFRRAFKRKFGRSPNDYRNCDPEA